MRKGETMPPTYLLPLITTKEQIGLGNVTNDEQLKKAGNLEDIDNVVLARSNLGLGTSAVKDVGISSDQVASGDHDHDGTYAPVLGEDDNYVTDAEKVKLSNLSGTNTGDQDLSGYSLTSHTHDEDDITGIDKYSQDEIDLMLKRLKGISLTQNDLLYMYNHNTKLIATCESDESWMDNAWNAASPATHGDDTTNYKVGSQGISITTTSDAANRGIYLDFSDKDLSKFEDGSASSDDDYIEVSIYCPDVTHYDSNGLYMQLHCNALGTITDRYKYSFESLLSNGWNHLKIQKSAFTVDNDADWSTITGISFTIRSDDGTSVSYTIDAIRMTRADSEGTLYEVSPGEAAGTYGPNPFQIENDGVMERVFEVSSGTPFLGYDGSALVVKAMENIEISSALTFGNIYFDVSAITSSTAACAIRQGADLNDHIATYLFADQIFTSKKIAGATTYLRTTISYPVSKDDEVSINGHIIGKTIYASFIKSGSNAYAYGLSTIDQRENKILVSLYSDASITSFKASSSPLMVN
jgi:hypothetical protein